MDFVKMQSGIHVRIGESSDKVGLLSINPFGVQILSGVFYHWFLVGHLGLVLGIQIMAMHFFPWHHCSAVSSSVICGLDPIHLWPGVMQSHILRVILEWSENSRSAIALVSFLHPPVVDHRLGFMSLHQGGCFCNGEVH